MDITIGADPEFFLKNKTDYISAHNLVPGTKSKPHPLYRGAVQADGTAVEFNIEPAFTADDFALSIQAVLAQVRAMIPLEYQFSYTPAVQYKENYFDELPEFSKELGCDPDYNAYTGAANPRPNPSKRYKTLRTGAGHLHIGFTSTKDHTGQSHMWDCKTLVQALDKYFMFFVERWDKDKTRQNLYGGWGAFRPKPYGVEYRVLSNAWLNHPTLWSWLFDSTVAITKVLGSGTNFVDRFFYNNHRLINIEDEMNWNKRYSEDYYARLIDENIDNLNQVYGWGLPAFPKLEN